MHVFLIDRMRPVVADAEIPVGRQRVVTARVREARAAVIDKAT